MLARLDRLQDAERHAVIGDQECLDVVVVYGQCVLGVGLRRLGLPARRELIHDDLDVALLDQRVEGDVVAFLHQRRARLARVAADQHIVAFRNLRDHGLGGFRTAVLGIAADIGGLFRAKDQVVVGRQRNAGLGGHLGDACSDVEIDRLDHDGVDALGDDVLGLRDLVLRVILGGLHERPRSPPHWQFS